MNDAEHQPAEETPTARDDPAPRSMETREAARRETGNSILLLEITRDDMVAALSIKPGPEAELDRDTVQALLEDGNVSAGLDSEAIDGALATANSGKPVFRTIIARGEEPANGRDGYVEFHKKPTGQKQLESETADQTSVDYREIYSFDNVVPGDVIGVYVPKMEGRGGVDVHGRVIPAREGKDITVTVGEHAEYDEATREYKALAKGHVTFEQKRIEVEPVYRVRRDVDLSQGNIRFIGRVEVGKDIRDDFVVKGDEGVWVGGTAEACQISSNADVVIEGGVTGKGRARIEARGNVFARFLDETHVISGGDIVITREVVNCKIQALGRVIVEKGAILGGEVVALKGVVVQDLGSDLGVKQRITAGIDYHVAEKLYSINAEARKVAERQQALLQKLGPLLERATKAAIVDNALRENIEDLWPQVKSLQKQIVRLEAKSGELSKDFADDAVERVEVRGKLYPGTTVVEGKFERTVESALTGPLLLRPDRDTRRVEVEPLTGDGTVGDPKPKEPEWLKTVHA